MPRLSKGRYIARLARTETDLRAAQALRHRCFRGGEGLDVDSFDDQCKHLLVEDTRSGALVACVRLMSFADGTKISDSYSAQYYGLSALEGYDAPMMEMGRFCIAIWHRNDGCRA